MTTYYVNASSGSDSNNGLAANSAWNTLSHAGSVAHAGDIVRLTGTFTDQQLAPASGVVFEGFPALGATLVGGSQFAVVSLSQCSAVTIRSIRIRDVLPSGYGHAFLLDQSSDNTISDCEILNVGSLGSDSGDSIFIQNGSSRNKILRNTSTNGGHSLIYVGGDRLGQAECGDNIIQDNKLSNPWGHAIGLINMARRTIVEGNTITNVNAAGANATTSTIQVVSRGNKIRRNIFTNNSAPGITLAAYVYTGHGENLLQEAQDNEITHNVFYGGIANSNDGGAAGIWMFTHAGAIRNNLFANNIFFRNAGVNINGQMYQIGVDQYSAGAWPAGSLDGNRFENNVILRQSGSQNEAVVLLIRQSGNLSYTLAQFQATYSAAKNNLAVDPMFVNAGAGDFHLALGSPCIDAGVRLADSVFTGSAPDIGCYEHVISGQTEPTEPNTLRLV